MPDENPGLVKCREAVRAALREGCAVDVSISAGSDLEVLARIGPPVGNKIPTTVQLSRDPTQGEFADLKEILDDLLGCAATAIELAHTPEELAQKTRKWLGGGMG